MVLGNTFHLFLTPGHELIAQLGGLHRFMRWDRPDHHRLGRLPGLLDGPRHGRRRDQGPRRPHGASAPGAILAIEEEGVRFRSYLDGSERFMGPETSMEVQAALGSDIALVFDECTPFHVDREYTARSTERTHRWLDRCLDWHARARPRTDQLVYGIVQGGVDEDLRRALARRRSPRARCGGIAIGGSLGAGQGADVRGRRLDDRRAAARTRPRHLLGIGEIDDLRARRRARHRHVRLRDADAPRPPRDGARAGPGAALARRPGQGRWRERRRAADGRLPVPGLRERLHARLPALPAQGARARRRCGC